MLAGIGPANIEQRVLQLASLIRKSLHDLGANTLANSSQIVAAQFPGRDVSAIARGLRERRVLVAARHGYLRVSPHFYNNEDDVAALTAEVRKAIA